MSSVMLLPVCVSGLSPDLSILSGCVGDRLPNELPGTLLIFLERLKNEITRLTTVKGNESVSLRLKHVELTWTLQVSTDSLCNRVSSDSI